MSIEECDLCGSTNVGALAGTKMIECRECTVQFPVEAPTSGVVTNQTPRPPSGRGPLLARRQAKLAYKVNLHKRLIDFGCGNGAFLHSFKQIDGDNCKIMGIELDESSVSAAQGAGIEVVHAVPDDVDHTMFTMWHVAEHLPVNTLRQELKKISRGDNQLLISVPNGDSHSWNRYKEMFSFFDSKSHMVQFTPISLEKLLQESGWDIQREIHTPIYGIFNAIQTGINLSRPHNEMYELLKRESDSVKAILYLKSLFAATRAIIPIVSMLIYEMNKKRGSSYTVLATAKGV
jgi:hypothetical protein